MNTTEWSFGNRLDEQCRQRGWLIQITQWIFQIINVSSLPTFLFRFVLFQRMDVLSHAVLSRCIFLHSAIKARRTTPTTKCTLSTALSKGMCPIWCPTGAVRAVHHTPHDDERHRSAHNKGEESAQQHEKISSFLLLWCYVWQNKLRSNFVLVFIFLWRTLSVNQQGSWTKFQLPNARLLSFFHHLVTNPQFLLLHLTTI